MTLPATPAIAEPVFGDAEFRALATLARRDFGLSLPENKKPLVHARLAKRLRARQMADLPGYLALIARADEDEERRELISALTTNVTSFFRERHHFDTLREACLPELAQRAAAGARVRVWSAGCSTGQEPYSIAMTMLDRCPKLAGQDVRILATDIDSKVVARARLAAYPAAERETIPLSYRDAYLNPPEPGRDSFTIGNPVRNLVTFAELNLVADWPFSGQFDAVFCRNVVIYFDKDTQEKLWARFVSALAPGGFLFIGHSERVTGPAAALLSMVGTTSYRKRASAATEHQDGRTT